MNSGKINPMAGVFLGVNNYGYRDVKQVDIAPAQPDKTDDYDADAIRLRYLIDSPENDSDSATFGRLYDYDTEKSVSSHIGRVAFSHGEGTCPLRGGLPYSG